MGYLLIAVAMLSCVFTGVLRRYAMARNVMDVPNHRSAHTVPTPRGGGVAFVLTILMTIPCLKWMGFLTPIGSEALMSAGVFVAALGFFDDHGHLSAAWRLLGHSVAAILALYWMGGVPSLPFYAWALPAGMGINILGFFYIVWLINLYNFMDGIDGIAGAEAICVCLGAAGLYWSYGDSGLVILPLVIAASVAGFLYWNWPSARIFMGDAGSGFLGFILAILSLQGAHMNPNFFWSWLILLGVFIVDATLTLLRRALRLENVAEAHSTHAYQHASRAFGAHLPVTVGVILINLLWLWPLACLVGLGKLSGLFGVGIAYGPLCVLAIKFRAGVNRSP
jgi:Fuc2NAc and GlcNAc transferase